MGADDHAFGTHERNAHPAKHRCRHEDQEKEKKQRTGRRFGRLAQHAHVLIDQVESRLFEDTAAAADVTIPQNI
jgi:hypothetical protein